MKYFMDMLIGACLEVGIILLVEFFYFPRSWMILLITGIIVLTIYTLFRLLTTKENPVKDSILKGIVLGIPLSFVAMDLFEDLIKEILYSQGESGMEGFTAIGNALSSGTVLTATIILNLITTAIFLKLLKEGITDKCDMKAKWKGETIGIAILLLPVGASLFYASLEFYNGVVKDIRSDISVLFLIGILLISFIIILLVYYCARGKNIRYIIASYILEMLILLVCSIKFSLSFSTKPMGGLGIMLFLGAVIYRGVEKFFLQD